MVNSEWIRDKFISLFKVHQSRALSNDDEHTEINRYRVGQFCVLFIGFVLHFSLSIVSLLCMLIETTEAPLLVSIYSETRVQSWFPGFFLSPVLMFLAYSYYYTLLLRWNNYIHLSFVPFRRNKDITNSSLPRNVEYTNVWVLFLSCLDCTRRTNEEDNDIPLLRRSFDDGEISTSHYEQYIDFAETLYFFTECIAFPLFMIQYVPIFGPTTLVVLLQIAAVAFAMPIFGWALVHSNRSYQRGSYTYRDNLLTFYSLTLSGLFMAVFIMLYVGKGDPTFSDGLATFGSSGIFFVIALAIRNASQPDPKLSAKDRLSSFLFWTLVRECANILKNMLFTWFLLYTYSLRFL